MKRPISVLFATSYGRILFNGTLHMFERAGFSRVRDLGTLRTIVRREVAPA